MGRHGTACVALALLAGGAYGWELKHFGRSDSCAANRVAYAAELSPPGHSGTDTDEISCVGFTHIPAGASTVDAAPTVSWGTLPGTAAAQLELTQSSRLSIANVYSNGYAFAALRSDGTVETWGGEFSGGNSSTVARQLSDKANPVVSITPSSNSYLCGCDGGLNQAKQGAFAALKQDGTVVTWGFAAIGGDSASVQAELTGVKALFTTGHAFAALKADKSVVAWGHATKGGSTTGVALTGVKTIFATQTMFAALKDDTSVVTWGYEAGNAVPSFAKPYTYSNVVAVVATSDLFSALLADSSCISWGYGAVQPPAGLKATKIYANTRAFAALTTDGSVIAWGDAASGGDVTDGGTKTAPGNVTAIVATSQAFAALQDDRTVVTWGMATKGGNSAQVRTHLIRVRELFASEVSFAALKDDGTVVTWDGTVSGASNGAGSGRRLSTSAVDVLSGVRTIVPNKQAFAALKHDKTVVTWGPAAYGGSSSAVAFSDIGALYASDQSFVAVRSPPPRAQALYARISCGATISVAYGRSASCLNASGLPDASAGSASLLPDTCATTLLLSPDSTGNVSAGDATMVWVRGTCAAPPSKMSTGFIVILVLCGVFCLGGIWSCKSSCDKYKKRRVKPRTSKHGHGKATHGYGGEGRRSSDASDSTLGGTP